MADNNKTVIELGRVPKERGIFNPSASPLAKFYKDNIVEYEGSAFIAAPTASVNDGNDGTQETPEYYLTRVPFTTDPASPNSGWRVFANGRHRFSTGEEISNVGIDATPTASSNNLVKSGGVQEELALGAVYNVSAKNPTAGPNSDGKWESLSALLSDANLNTLIPTAVRKGGMSIKFVQTSDNKYVKFFCTADEFTTDVTKWQGVDDKPIDESDNLVKSGGVAKYIKNKNVPIDISSMLEKKALTDDGKITAGSVTYHYTDPHFYPIEEGGLLNWKLRTLTVDSVYRPVICFYSSADESAFVSLVRGNSDNMALTQVPTGVNFFRFCTVDEAGIFIDYISPIYNKIDSRSYFINVNQLNGLPDTAYADVATARAAIPYLLRKQGMVCAYLIQNIGWCIDRFDGRSVTDAAIAVDSYWINIIDEKTFNKYKTEDNAEYFRTIIKNGFVHKAYLASNNQEIGSNDYYITPFIEVQPNKLYNWHTSEVANDVCLICYDNNKVPFQYRTATASLTNLDTSGSTYSNIKYVRVSFKNNSVGSFGIFENSIETPLWTNNIDFNSVPALFDEVHETIDTIENLNGFEPETKLTSSTTKSDDPNYYVTPFIKVNKNRYTWVTSEADNTYMLEYDSSFNRVNTAKATAATITRDYRNNTVAYVRATFKTNNVGGLYENYENGFTYVKKTVWKNDHNYNTDKVGYQVIKEKITPIQTLLNSIVSAGYKIAGVVTTTDTPLDTSIKVAYLASTAGTYTNFGNVVISSGELALIKQDSTTFTKESVLTISVESSVIEEAVADWLDAHPEATTTVQDGSITPAKLATDYFNIPSTQEAANTMLGRYSAGAISGNSNVSIGFQNLQNNTGNKNIAIGVQNLCDNAADHNLAIGYHSGFRVTTGEKNVGLGSETNDDLQTGSHNIALGGWCLKRNNVGSRNIAIGTNALHGNYGDNTYMDEHDFSDNIAIGYEAAKQVLSGAKENILIGNNTQILNNGQNQIVIGHGAYANTNNCCVIGNSNTYLFILGRGNSAAQLRIGNKKLIFNQDGTVTWEIVS